MHVKDNTQNPVNSNRNCKTDDTDLSAQSIRSYLNEEYKNLDIKVYKTLTSTNTVLKEMAADGASEGTVLVAESQTFGRGRMGRNFYSPSDTGIYFSILLRPDIPVEESLFLTTAAAVAIAKSIESVKNCKASIKWVNDIYIDGRKVCGILTEGSINSQTNRLNYAVVGMGINVCPPKDGFPEEIENLAGAVFTRKENSADKRSILIAEILNLFMDYYKNLSSKCFFEEYKNRSFLLGEDIYVIQNEQYIPAKAIDIDKKCQLIVEFKDGTTQALSSGEVSIRLNR